MVFLQEERTLAQHPPRTHAMGDGCCSDAVSCFFFPPLFCGSREGMRKEGKSEGLRLEKAMA